MVLYLLVFNYGDINMEEYNKIVNELVSMKQELLLIKKYMDRIESLLDIIKNNRVRIKRILYLKTQLNMGFFNKDRRRNIKNEINELNAQMVNINTADEMRKIRKDFENEVVSKYNEYENINELFKTISISDMLNILSDIYSKKAHIYNSKIDTYFEIQDKLYNNHIKILK